MCNICTFQRNLCTVFLKIFQKVKIVMLRWNIMQYLKKFCDNIPVAMKCWKYFRHLSAIFCLFGTVLLDLSISYSASLLSLQALYPRIPLTKTLNQTTLNRGSSVFEKSGTSLSDIFRGKKYNLEMLYINSIFKLWFFFSL